MHFKSGIIVVKKGMTKINDEIDILHFCGYEGTHNTKEEWELSKDELYNELKNDKELCFEWDLDDCVFVKLEQPDELLDYYNEQFKDIDRND